ncbi:hypothetical protein [Flavobacterium sp. UBA6046]|jgi:hypothetical protein|uniref:hypothetical protein n=1 Tax=Flavobacterium sp. UBA6046 TaxID=1946552 RepID=UPI0025C44C67|nr:hypothetical protein [Flavobacterium sp. UBA6046]
MTTELSSDVISTLKQELRLYQENMNDVLNNYTDFESLDISAISKDGFKFEGTKKGTSFIDKLRTFFHKKNIDYPTSLWIINKWGGIGSFKDSELNKQRISKFESGLKKRKLSKDLFSVISSLSKIASFMNSEEYFVYDSRVIYSLNWLILKNNIPNAKFFPMPESRSKILTLFDLNTIINLFYMENITNDEYTSKLFFDTKNAYFLYCDLIKELSKELFPDLKPYYLEMLLFVIADNQIFDDLRSTVQLTIKK